MKEGRKPEYPEKTPDDELQKMPNTKKPEDSSPKQDPNPAQQHWLLAGKANVLTVTPRFSFVSLLVPRPSEGV